MASDALCTGMEVAILSAWLREPLEGQEHLKKREVEWRTAAEETLLFQPSGSLYNYMREGVGEAMEGLLAWAGPISLSGVLSA